MMNCTVKKQDVSNVTEKNDTEFIMMRKKTEKRQRSFSFDNTDDSEN